MFFIKILKSNQQYYILDHYHDDINNLNYIKENKKSQVIKKIYLFQKKIYLKIFFNKLKKIHIENIRNNINEIKIFNCLCLEKIYNMYKTCINLKLYWYLSKLKYYN